MIKKYCISYGVWIDSYKDDSSQSKILMKLVLDKKYDIKLSNWDMDHIKEVKIEYGKLSRVIVYQQEVLQGKRPDRSQGQPALSKISPHIYRSN